MTARLLGLMVRATNAESGNPFRMSTTTDETTRSIARTRGLSAALDWAGASHGRAVALLFVFALIAFLPGFFQIPPVDRDEARFAQATKQMIETGQYVDIRFQDEVRYKKPVGIYWLQAGFVKLGEAVGVPRAHTRIWLYRPHSECFVDARAPFHLHFREIVVLGGF